MKPDLQPFLDRLTIHSRLNETEREALLGLPTHVLRVDAHRDFVRLDETVDHACVVVEGVVARFGQNAEGERQITALHVPGDAPDLHLVVLPTDTCPLQALSNASLLRIPHVALRAVSARYPGVAEAFWRHCSMDAAVTAQWVVNMGRHNAKTRISHLMCETAVRYNADISGGEVSFFFPLTQTHLADATGLTPVHINRTLKALAEEGFLIISDRTARIPDWERLVRRGEFDARYLQTSLQPEERLRIVD